MVTLTYWDLRRNYIKIESAWILCGSQFEHNLWMARLEAAKRWEPAR